MSRVDRALRLILAINVLSAYFMVLLSEEIGLQWLLPFLPLFLAGLLWGSAQASRRAKTGLTAAIIVLFVLLTLRAAKTGLYLENAVIFAVYACAARSLQIPSSRQLMQVLALAFLLMLSGSVMNPDLSFAFLFLPYAVSLTWGLLLVHLKGETEGVGALSWKVDRLVRPTLFAGTAVLALLLVAGSWLVFLLFPRLGLGFFSVHSRAGRNISGFSDTVQLGHFGNIETSDNVVLRVRLPDGRRRNDLYLVGAIFNRYESGTWTRGVHHGNVWLSRDEAGWLGVGDIALWQKPEAWKPRHLRPLEYEVYQEPLGGANVFTVPTPVVFKPLQAEFDRFQGTSKSFFLDRAGNIGWKGRKDVSLAISARSLELDGPGPWMNDLQEDPEQVHGYLQLPENLDPRIAQLGKVIAGQVSGRYQKAQTIADYLRSTYKYSLEGGHNPKDPLADFLFGLKRGHCEYFSSAMVLLLRTQGIPTRQANGFHGGRFNEFGGFQAFAEADAHSWVQVLFPGVGWVDFDPTPAAGREPEQGLGQVLSMWMDAVRLQWFRWVIEYDLENQIGVYSKIWSVLSGSKSMGLDSGNLDHSSFHKAQKEFKAGAGRFGWGLLALFLGLNTLWGLVVVVRLARGRLARNPGRRLEEGVRRRLNRLGFQVKRNQTLLEAASAGGLEPSVATLLHEIAAEVEQLRWSGAGDLTASKGRLKTLLSRLAQGPRPWHLDSVRTEERPRGLR